VKKSRAMRNQASVEKAPRASLLSRQGLLDYAGQRVLREPQAALLDKPAAGNGVHVTGAVPALHVRQGST